MYVYIYICIYIYIDMYVCIYIYSHPQIDGQVNHHQNRRVSLFIYLGMTI